eukprot:TRINITY_DN4632_c0_g1_i1.p1 TRINITY_DN4632_c0_g1~~TRINITY_DN4632_c0_g1_i1.p1  ORF type:complete len:372 (-),score=56.68 TRINITY_DN4632_c0_g1_i1:48-1163(-)
MPTTAAQVDELVHRLGAAVADPGLKADVKRLLGLVDGNWFTALFTPGESAKSRAWVLTAELAFWGTGNRLRLVGHIVPHHRDKSFRVNIILWLPLEYPNGYPALFIVPAKHTRIVERHSNVGQDGMFYHPYISTWDPNHTLEELLAALIAVINERPILEDTTLQDLAAGVIGTFSSIGTRIMEGARQAQQATSSAGISSQYPGALALQQQQQQQQSRGHGHSSPTSTGTAGATPSAPPLEPTVPSGATGTLRGRPVGRGPGGAAARGRPGYPRHGARHRVHRLPGDEEVRLLSALRPRSLLHEVQQRRSKECPLCRHANRKRPTRHTSDTPPLPPFTLPLAPPSRAAVGIIRDPSHPLLDWVPRNVPPGLI